MSLDHIVLAVPDLDAAVAEFAARTGVTPARGGSHVGLGSANHLVGLGGGAYLEIVGRDPEQPDPTGPRPFGIDDLAAPRIVTWAVRAPDVDAAVRSARAGGYDPGDPAPMSRRTPDGELLAWRLTPPAMAGGVGIVPFLIDWGATPHPTARGLPSVPLLEWRAEHPAPERIRPALAALGAELDVAAGSRPALLATVGGASGPLRLGSPP